MGRDLVQKKDGGFAKVLRQGAGVGQDQTDQQGLLLSGRALVGGGVLGGVAGHKVGAVRADQSAPGGDVAAAAFGQRSRQIVRLVRAIGAGQGKLGPGKGAGGVGGGGNAGDGGAAVLGDLVARLGHLGFQCCVPMRIGDLILDQPVPVAHRLVVCERLFGMFGKERQRQPIQKAAATLGRLDPQPVHRRDQPKDAHHTTKLGLRGGLSVDPDLARLGRFGPGLQLMRGGKPLYCHGNLPAKRFRPSGQIIGSGAAQAPARGQKGHRLQHVGLARAVRPDQRHGAAVKVQPLRAVAPEMRQGEGFDDQAAHAVSFSERALSYVRPASA